MQPKTAMHERLAQLGMMRGRKSIMPENKQGSNGITFIRSLIEQIGDTTRTCELQRRHCDRAREGSLSGKDLRQVPLSVEWAVQEETTMVVQGERICIPKGYMMIWLGDLCHQGDAYSKMHTRVHAYLDPYGPSLPGADSVHGCAAAG